MIEIGNSIGVVKLMPTRLSVTAPLLNACCFYDVAMVLLLLLIHVSYQA